MQEEPSFCASSSFSPACTEKHKLPLQLHGPSSSTRFFLFMNFSGELQIIDLWYDWPRPKGQKLQHHSAPARKILYDLEWNNGTSFFYTLDANQECRSAQLEVGILRPNWLDGANYLGQQYVDGFLCNVWEKVDFIWYYEDVVTKRPVHWVFYTGRAAHVMTFEVGAVLEDEKWQAPVYCFDKEEEKLGRTRNSHSEFDEVFMENLAQERGSRVAGSTFL